MHAGVEQGAPLGVLDQVGRDRQRHRPVLAFDHILQPPDQAAAGHGIELRRHESLTVRHQPSTARGHGILTEIFARLAGMSPTIESYGLIGDCQTSALVALDGSIDWLCWPRFDSDACFAALLGDPSHGRWLITAADETVEVSRCYRPNTLVLETTFKAKTGQATVIDFMLPRDKTSDLIRLVRGDQGWVPMRMELVLRFGYGATIPWVSRLDDGTVRAVAGPDMVVLRTPTELKGQDFKTLATFMATAGSTTPFVLSYGPSHLPAPEPIDAEKALESCVKFWRDWTDSTKCHGPHS